MYITAENTTIENSTILSSIEFSSTTLTTNSSQVPINSTKDIHSFITFITTECPAFAIILVLFCGLIIFNSIIFLSVSSKTKNIESDDDRKKLCKIVRDLAKIRGEDLNRHDENGITALDLLAEIFDIELIKVLKASNAHLYSRTSTGDNLLTLVCKNIAQKNNESVAHKLIDWLLDKKFNANSKNNSNFTPLHYASKLFYNLDIIKSLVNAGADIHAVANDNTNPLHSATMSSSFEVMQYFIERGVDLNRRDNIYRYSLIHMAAMSYDEKNVKWLLANGFDPNDLSIREFTPLHLASRIGSVKVVEKLIENGANVNCREIYCKYTPLHLAVMKGKSESIITSITTSSDEQVDDNLSLVRRCLKNFKLKTNENDYKEIVVMLLKAGAVVNAKDHRGCTPLHYVTRQSNNNFIELLLAAGARIDDRDSEGFSPLQNCLLSGNDKGLESLLIYGADISEIEHPRKNVMKEAKESANLAYDCILKHLVKLKVAQLPINEICKTYLDNTNLDEHYSKCVHELLQLKKQMLTPHVSLYDLLHMDSKFVITFAKNLPTDLEIKFPYYHVLIRSKYNAAIKETLPIELS